MVDILFITLHAYIIPSVITTLSWLNHHDRGKQSLEIATPPSTLWMRGGVLAMTNESL